MRTGVTVAHDTLPVTVFCHATAWMKLNYETKGSPVQKNTSRRDYRLDPPQRQQHLFIFWIPISLIYCLAAFNKGWKVTIHYVIILLKFLRCYRSVYVLLKDAGQWQNLLQVRFYINKNLPSEIWDGLIRQQVVWTSMLKSPCLILQMAGKILELCNNNLWCVLHVRWAIYGKCFGKNDYSCASISHRFWTRLKILYCILSECCIYTCARLRKYEVDIRAYGLVG